MNLHGIPLSNSGNGEPMGTKHQKPVGKESSEA